MNDGQQLVSFFVPGIPAPGGSKRHIGGGRMIDASKRNRPWRTAVAEFGMKAWNDACAANGWSIDPTAIPLAVVFHFTMPRPKAHYRSNGEVKPNAPRFHSHAPDATKLVRSTEDALTGIVWRDDGQIARQSAAKHYGERPGVTVTVWAAE